MHLCFENWGNFRNESFFNKKYNLFVCRCFEPETSVLAGCHSSGWTIVVQCWLVCLRNVRDNLSTCLIFNPSWICSSCNMFMCTNKTCFARFGTWQKPLFRIRISCLSYPCESKKNQNFLSADQTSIPGVNQVFPVLEWNLIFVLLSKILDRLKRSFVVQIPRVTFYREMRNIYV